MSKDTLKRFIQISARYLGVQLRDVQAVV